VSLGAERIKAEKEKKRESHVPHHTNQPKTLDEHRVL
jgi:hypothetical protein